MHSHTQKELILEDDENSRKDWFEELINYLNINEESGWPDHFGEALIKFRSENSNSNIRVLSLFSGGGGLDIGFHDAGFNIIECNEIEKDFAATLIANSKDGGRLQGANIVCKDIRQYKPGLSNIDFIIGGPPCQTFSAAGARCAGVNGVDDDRGTLFEEYVRILKELKPKGFLFENVYRIIGAQNGEAWRLIQEAFKSAGYKLYWRVLDAADYGVPQHRERLIIVGLRDGIFHFPRPTHGPDSRKNRPFYTASKAIETSTSKEPGSIIGGRHGHLLNDIPPGLNYSFYTERMGHPTPFFGWRSKFSDYLYKAAPETPVRTIKAQGGQYTGPFHWDSRTFTLEELKRLQTFPDNYEVIGKRQKAIHQLGNSVPPQLGRILALSILEQVFNESLPVEIEVIPDSFKLTFRTRKSALTKWYAKKAEKAISSLDVGKMKHVNTNGTDFVEIDDSLKLHVRENQTNSTFAAKYDISNQNWNFFLLDKSSNNTNKYSINITFPSSTENGLINSINLMSGSAEIQSISLLWKYLEKVLKEQTHKDDIVQLMGHYKSKTKFHIHVHINDSEMNNDLFWRVFKDVTEGSYVGKEYPIEDVASFFSCNDEDLYNVLKRLKRIGFEIRNHNTNSQISTGNILIPYSFPTLNERSLQRLTEL